METTAQPISTVGAILEHNRIGAVYFSGPVGYESPQITTKLPGKQAKLRTFYLTEVRRDLEARLKASLHNARFMELGLDHDPAAVQPWGYYNPEKKEDYKTIEEAFRLSDKRLLILGRPGAGKTTALLHVAINIARIANTDEAEPIPVIVNLSKFRFSAKMERPFRRRFLRNDTRQEQKIEAATDRSIEDWLISEIAKFPGLDRRTVKDWLHDGRFALLMDGLDEFNSDRRGEFTQLLNQTLLRDHPAMPIVVCSRFNEYEVLRSDERTRLALKGAVAIQPLSEAQVKAYLYSAKAENLLQLIAADNAVAELSRTPLTLSVLVLAYAGMEPLPSTTRRSFSETRSKLFEAYVARMLQRQARRENGKPFDDVRANDIPASYYRYRPSAVDRWLGWLALTLSTRMRTTFSPNKLVSLLLTSDIPERQFLNIWAAYSAMGIPIIICLILAIISSSPLHLIGYKFMIGAMLAGWILMSLGGSGVRGSTWGRLALNFQILVGFYGFLNSTGYYLSLNGFMSYFYIKIYALVSLVLLSTSIYSSKQIATNLKERTVSLILSALLIFIALGDAAETVRVHLLNFYIGIDHIFILVILMSICLSYVGAMPKKELMVMMVEASYWIIVSVSIFIYGRNYQNNADYFLISLILIISGLLSMCSSISHYICLLLFCFCILLTLIMSNFIDTNMQIVSLFILPVLIFTFILNNTISNKYTTTIYDLIDKYIMSNCAFIVMFLFGNFPLNKKSFFRFTIDSFLLKRIGSDYEFIHRLLRDYFALNHLTSHLKLGGDNRLRAIQNLGYQGEAALDLIVEFVSEDDKDTRAAALLALRYIPSAVSTECFRNCLADSRQEVRFALLLGIQTLPRSEQRWFLTQIVPLEDNAEIVYIINNYTGKVERLHLFYIARIGIDGIKSLVKMLGDSSEKIRFASADHLMAILPIKVISIINEEFIYYFNKEKSVISNKLTIIEYTNNISVIYIVANTDEELLLGIATRIITSIVYENSIDILGHFIENFNNEEL